MYQGGEVYLTRDPLIEHGHEHLWYTWATCYKGGSIDAGHFMLGNNRFGFAILADETGAVHCTTDVDGAVIFDDDNYWQTGARFWMGDIEYEFLPDPRGRMPDLGPIPNPQVDGRWRRVGDTREPDVWFAWGEAVPANGLRPHRRTYKPIPYWQDRPSMRVPVQGERCLHAEHHGECNGHAVVLIHGGAMNRGNWDGVVPALVDAGRCTITFDMRACGLSERDFVRMDVPTLGADVVRVLRGCGIERAAVVGWSVGGAIAVAAAHALGPRLDRLVVISGATPRLLADIDYPGFPREHPPRAP